MLQCQVKSNDIKSLIEMMTFLSQVRSRQEYTDDMAQPIKDTIELLKSYSYEVPQSIYAMLDELPEQWIIIKKLAKQMKQHIAPLQANQVANIRNQILDMDKKQQELRERFLRDAPFKYDTKKPYVGKISDLSILLSYNTKITPLLKTHNFEKEVQGLFPDFTSLT